MSALKFLQRILPLIILSGLLLLNSCARGPDAQDPYEHYNRNTARLNNKVDTNFLKPVAQGYQAITTYPMRRSVTNFFDNLNETDTIGNDILQGRVYWSFNDLWRLIINSTVGVVGLFDVASDAGLTKHTNNFSLTLTSWGYEDPDYLVLPLLGPSTTAGLIAIPADFALTPWRYKLHPLYLEELLFALEVVNLRASYLDQEDLAAQLAFDPYIFTRSAFLQHRNYLLQINSNPPLQNTVQAHEAEAALNAAKSESQPTYAPPSPPPAANPVK